MNMAMKYADHDTSLAQSFTLRFKSGGNVEFQFPPRVTSDGRKGQWNESEIRGREVVAVMTGTSARVFSVTVRYVVDGCTWDAAKISKNLRLLRGYFMKPTAGQHEFLVAYIKCWQIGGSSECTCRLSDVNVKHGETIVGEGDDAFPMVTDVTLDVRLWSKGGGDASGEVQKVQALKGTIPLDWY